MNYSLLLKEELIKGAPRNACCKRAYAAGILFDLREMRENCLVLVLTSAAARHECARVYRELYRREALMNGTVMLFASEKLYGVYKDPPVFACAHCRAQFLRGLLVACGSMTSPQKAYHLEFRLANAEKVPVVAEYFKDMGWTPGCRKIDCGVGLYFKKYAVIEEILSTVGANQALFTLMNAKIARGIRNEENRATNCDARNIGRAVDAATKHCNAIKKIQDAGMLEQLPPELRETADLRVENQEISLIELARMHNPPITKSGLNHRLQKILTIAQNINEEDT